MKYFVQIIGVFILMTLSINTAMAQFTLLPNAPEGADCEKVLNNFEMSGDLKGGEELDTEQALSDATSPENIMQCNHGVDEEAQKAACDAIEKAIKENDAATNNPQRDEVLGCAIKTGRISLSMVPYFITYLANFLLAMSGIVTVLFIVIGGFYYVYGGVVDNKEKGKKTIMYAVGGMVLALLSWVIVQTIITIITS